MFTLPIYEQKMGMKLGQYLPNENNPCKRETKYIDEGVFKKIEMTFKHQIGVLMEDVQHKLDIVVEGQGMLADKLERTGDDLKEEIQKVNQRLTMAEANLSKKMVS